MHSTKILRAIPAGLRSNMRRVLSSLLIVILLITQGLCALHSHIGIDSDEHSGLERRPHFHAHGSHSHGSHRHAAEHTHQTPTQSSDSDPDSIPLHDTDAFYFADSICSSSPRLDTTLAISRLISDVFVKFDEYVVTSNSDVAATFWNHDASGVTARVPLFLRGCVILC
jgi:hypothetical protein